MKLYYEPLGLEITADEGQAVVLQIESEHVMREFMHSLWKQISGGEGNIVIYDDKVVTIVKTAEMITNIFDIDINNKKIISRIYRELEDIARTELIGKTNQFQSDAVLFIENVIEKCQYQIDFDTSLDFAGLFKILNLHLRQDYDTVLENFVEYLKLAHKVCGINYFFTYHLKEILSLDELKSLYEMCSYEKIYLFLLESCNTKKVDENEKTIVVDKDLCII